MNGLLEYWNKKIIEPVLHHSKSIFDVGERMSALLVVARVIRRNFLFRLYKYYIFDSVIIIKRNGFKELIRQRGLKFLLIIISYYLVRDSLIYVVIPFLLARGLL
jgi:hypothetical protein